MKGLYFLINSSILIGLVLIIRRILRKQIAPGMLYALWLIPLIRLLIPFGFVELPAFTGAPAFFSAPYTIFEEQEILPDQPADSPDISSPMTSPKSPANTTAPSENPPAFSENEQSLDPASVIPGIWLCGSLVLFFYVVVSNCRLKRSIRFMDEAHRDCLLPVCCSDAVVSPCLFGLIHPCILVNRSIMEDEELYRNVLRHELTHYCQKDHLWTFLRIALCVIYWWHPLVWIGAACAREDAELACDAKVIRNLSLEERKQYGYALLRLLEYAQNGRRNLYAATSMSGGKKNIKRRMEGITRQVTTKRRVFLPICILLMAVLLYGCGVPAAGSWMRTNLHTLENQAPGWMEAEYEFSLQDDIQSRLFYYEIYNQGVLTERHLLAYGDLAEDRNKPLTITLERMAAEGLPEAGHYITLEQSGLKTRMKLQFTDFPETEYEGYVPGTGEGKQQVQSGDDLILMTQSVQTYDQTILIHMILSGLPGQELADQFKPSEHPAVSDHADSRKTVDAWAGAFASRNGETLTALMTEELADQMEEDGLLIRGADYISFGWSSPWPMSGESNYRIINYDDQNADILYYAWDSSPHIYVWRETLALEQRNGSYLVSAEKLEDLSRITSAEEFYRAYPDGMITGTPMDYLANGMGEVLNRNAQEYDHPDDQRLFDPGQSACFLLNLSLTGEGSLSGTDIMNFISAEDSAGTAAVQVTFPEDGSTVELSMIQPYGEDGIWIPQTAGFTG